MDFVDPFLELRHELRSRLQHLLGYGEVLREDVRENRGIDTNPLLQVLKSRGEILRKEIEAVDKTTLETSREAISVPLLEIHGASRSFLRDLQDREQIFLREDVERILEGADGMLDFLEERIAILAPSVQRGEDALTIVTNRGEPIFSSRRRGTILLVDDSDMNRDMLSRHLGRQGHRVLEAASGREALSFLAGESVDLVLLDIMMPGMNGYQVLKAVKSDPSRRELPVIMLSAIEDPESVARCIELGAEDYLSKSSDPILLKARIETTLEKKHLRDQEKIYLQALLESRKELLNELSEAAQYVRRLLPEPLEEPLRIEWRYHPSAQLGGDSFGYHRLADGRYALYLLDVSGHGIGSALLSVSVLNMLRNHALGDADFTDPASVLTSLNRKFRMEDQNNMFFTLWYGICDPERREVFYSCAGAPPAVLASGEGTEILKTKGPAVGIIEEASYESRKHEIPAKGKLFLFSDGAYEVRKKSGPLLTFDEFRRLIAYSSRREGRELDHLLEKLTGLMKNKRFEDDLSLIEVVFPG